MTFGGVAGPPDCLTKSAAGVWWHGGSTVCPVWARFVLSFSKSLQFSAWEQKRASSSHFFPLHTPFDFSTHHPSHSHTCAGSFPIHHHDCQKVQFGLPTRICFGLIEAFPSHHRHSSVSAPSPELKPAPPLPKPAPYEYGHSSSQPQPESSSVLLRSPLALHRLSTVTSHSSTLQTHPLWRSRREPPSTPHVSGTRHRSCLCISTTKFPSTDTPTLPSSYSSFATRGSLVAPIPAPTVEQNRQKAPDAFMFMPTYQPNIPVCPMLKQSPVYH